jgi:hypothetical protein
VTLLNTAEAEEPITVFSYSSYSTKEKVEPSMIGLLSPMFLLPSSKLLAYLLNYCPFLMSSPFSISLQESAIFSAVSSLSPVSITNFIPPDLSEKIVSAT